MEQASTPASPSFYITRPKAFFFGFTIIKIYNNFSLHFLESQRVWRFAFLLLVSLLCLFIYPSDRWTGFCYLILSRCLMACWFTISCCCWCRNNSTCHTGPQRLRLVIDIVMECHGTAVSIEALALGEVIHGQPQRVPCLPLFKLVGGRVVRWSECYFLWWCAYCPTTVRRTFFFVCVCERTWFYKARNMSSDITKDFVLRNK